MTLKPLLTCLGLLTAQFAYADSDVAHLSHEPLRAVIEPQDDGKQFLHIFSNLHALHIHDLASDTPAGRFQPRAPRTLAASGAGAAVGAVIYGHKAAVL